MLKKIILYLILFSLISCDNSKIETLEKKISELENTNKKLNAKLNQAEFTRVTNLQLNLIQNEHKLKVGKNNVISGKFFEISKLHKYDLYQTDSLNSKKSRKLLLKNITEPFFEINFNPKSKNDNKLHVLAVFNLDTLTVTFPASNQFLIE